MVLLTTVEEWQLQSALLLEARPTTARITTKYKIPNLDSPKYLKSKKRNRTGEAEVQDATAAKVPKAVLVLKTYDPESGVVLKFKTDKAADVGRLIAGLGRLGRRMAALPDNVDDTKMEDATVVEQAVEGATAGLSVDNGTAPASAAKPAPTGGGSGGAKKKKKGKR